MRTAAFLLTIVVAPLGVSGTSTAQGSCSDYDFAIRFFPAFHLAAAVTVSARSGAAELAITYGNARARGHGNERLTLSSSISEAFCSRLLQLISVGEKPADRLVVDGISVEGTFRHGTSSPHVFSFRSPNPRDRPSDYGIVDALFTVFESTLVSCELNESLEHLALYFHFGLPARIVSETPYAVRFWGGFTATDDNDLARLLASLPRDRPVTFDLTNWDSEGTLPPQFQQLITGMPRLKWIVSPKWAGTLSRLGADRANIEVREGPNCTLQRTRFARR
jgi:hypothetical protein